MLVTLRVACIGSNRQTETAMDVCSMNEREARERATAGEVVLVYLKGIALAAALMNVLEYLMWMYAGWK